MTTHAPVGLAPADTEAVAADVAPITAAGRGQVGGDGAQDDPTEGTGAIVWMLAGLVVFVVGMLALLAGVMR